ncbi:hypothetical protein FSP39_006800 [Pinctada imbricata]|uniref:Integrin alpha FG-GAP repeat containing 2 n=1 Tax=Pinctada imbricata TaxID=66713 RepID=A0AA89C4P0_PINIB|nr:hypothetical protein FSP39_006800 [Pinctada imbricata]
MWRTVSFVDRIELDFTGNLFKQAIVLGDVDNDKGHELVVGSAEGDLCIYKGKSSTPWRKCRDLGMISCVGVGDIYSRGKNVLVTLTAEGWCYIFDIKTGTDEAKESENEGDITLTSSFTQLLPANGKVLLICDIDGDGKTELVVGYADRVVRCFKWMPVQDEGTESTVDKLMQIGKWQLNGQIGSLTLNLTPEGMPELLVAQPGGAYAILLLNQTKTDIPKQGSELDLVSLVETTETVKEERPGHLRTRNPTIDTEIVGGIAKQTREGKDTYCAICTLDGTLLLVENREILWSLQVDHQLFSLAKLDVTGNGKEEVVCCSWDGQTYIVNHNKAVVRYQFESDVSAFTAGHFAVDGTQNNPSFVYATFNNKIYLYYNISLPQVESTNLIEVMDKSDKTHELLEKLGLQVLCLQYYLNSTMLSVLCLQYYLNSTMLTVIRLQYYLNSTMLSVLCLQYYLNSTMLSVLCLQYYLNSTMLTVIRLQYYLNSTMLSVLCLQYYLNSTMLSVLCLQYYLNSTMLSVLCLQYYLNSTMLTVIRLQYYLNSTMLSVLRLQYYLNSTMLSVLRLQYYLNSTMLSVLCLQYYLNSTMLSVLCLQYYLNSTMLTVIRLQYYLNSTMLSVLRLQYYLNSTMLSVLRLQYYLNSTMLSVLCLQYYLNSTMLSVLCLQYYLNSTMLSVLCLQYYLNSTMLSVLCLQYYLNSTMLSVPCLQYYLNSTMLSVLRLQYYVNSTMLSVLRLQYYVISTTFTVLRLQYYLNSTTFTVLP